MTTLERCRGSLKPPPSDTDWERRRCTCPVCGREDVGLTNSRHGLVTNHKWEGAGSGRAK